LSAHVGKSLGCGIWFVAIPAIVVGGVGFDAKLSTVAYLVILGVVPLVISTLVGFDDPSIARNV
jgi:hypothetical protein